MKGLIQDCPIGLRSFTGLRAGLIRLKLSLFSPFGGFVEVLDFHGSSLGRKPTEESDPMRENQTTFHAGQTKPNGSRLDEHEVPS